MAAEDLAGKPVGSLVWNSPEGIPIKPLYTVEDTKGLEVQQIPGAFPYTRGVRSTMYTGSWHG